MERKKRVDGRRRRGLTGTPVIGRYRHRRLLTFRGHEALPEEPEEEEVKTSIRPAQCTSVFRSSRPACTGNAEHDVVSPAIPAGERRAPAWRTAVTLTPEPEALRRGGVGDEEQTTPRNSASSSTGTESTFSSDDDEEDCYSSSSSSSSSLSSPEIFRGENSAGTPVFPAKDEALDPHLHVKNSTLLDVSYAKNIHMHGPPDISTIFDECEENPAFVISHQLKPACLLNCPLRTDPATRPETPVVSNHRGPEAETGTQTDSFKSADNRGEAFKRISPVDVRKSPQLPNGRVSLCKKKVSLKAAVVAVNQEVQRTSVTGTTLPNSSESAGRPGPAEQVRPRAEGSGVGGMNSDHSVPRLRVTLKRPVRRSPEKARFFDFASEADRDLFFQRARERSAKLWSFTFSPLTAAKSTDTATFGSKTVKTRAKRPRGEVSDASSRRMSLKTKRQ